MPRKPRYQLPGVACHVVQRVAGGVEGFASDADCRFFLECLRESAFGYTCLIHAYVLMPDHVHLLLTPADGDGVSRMMQSVGRRYVQHFNREHGRSGSLWAGRYRASLVESGAPLLDCQRYIETNPLRHALVDRADGYRWSSCAWHLGGRNDRLVADHPSYHHLGDSAAERRRRYAELLCRELPPRRLQHIRETLNAGMPLGSDDFHRRIESELRLALGHLHRGRPRKRGQREPAQRRQAQATEPA